MAGVGCSSNVDAARDSRRERGRGRGRGRQETDMKMRHAAADDCDRMKEIAVAAGMFSVEEVGFFDEMLSGALEGRLEGMSGLSSRPAMAL